MPPLICASPVILDQSFPRSDYELHIVSDALGEIQYMLENDLAHLILTEELEEIVKSYSWADSKTFEIYRMLSHWFLQKHSRLIEVDVSQVQKYSPHPIPRGSDDKGLTMFWAEDVGRLLVIHDQFSTPGQFFIGVCCESAFAGGDIGEYKNPEKLRSFPLVGPDNIGGLDDAYIHKWELPSSGVRRKVKKEDIETNYKVIGAESIEWPRGSSHAKLNFKNGREWTLDLNIDPVSEDHLPGLAAISGFPVNVLKYALTSGHPPTEKLRLKIEQYVK